MGKSNKVGKVVVLFLLLGGDLAMNCSVDYDNYNLSGTDLIAVPLAIQLVIEISIFLVIFLSMADTYLFRVGLLGVLLKKFRSILLIHPFYMSLTLVTGAYRIRRLKSEYNLIALWDDDGFVVLSLIQKLGEAQSKVKSYLPDLI